MEERIDLAQQDRCARVVYNARLQVHEAKQDYNHRQEQLDAWLSFAVARYVERERARLEEA
jgi:hypothetical protein